MPGIIGTAMEEIPWAERFAKVAGYPPPDGMTEAQAQAHLMDLIAARDARPANITIDAGRVAELWGNTGKTGQGTGTRPTK
jgi:hypothetical protein